MRYFVPLRGLFTTKIRRLTGSHCLGKITIGLFKAVLRYGGFLSGDLGTRLPQYFPIMK